LLKQRDEGAVSRASTGEDCSDANRVDFVEKMPGSLRIAHKPRLPRTADSFAASSAHSTSSLLSATTPQPTAR